jgi:hypothetical protein
MDLDIYPTGTLLILKKDVLVGPFKYEGEKVMVGRDAYPIWQVAYSQSVDPKLKTIIPTVGRNKDGKLEQLWADEFDFYVEELVSDLPKLFNKII